MDRYRDPSTLITTRKIRLKGLLMPRISNVAMDLAEIESVKVVSLSPLARMNIVGTQDLKTWWTFDSARPLKKHGFIIRFAKFKYHLGFTVSDFDGALEFLKANLGDKITDLRTAKPRPY